jgi:hypothetical protein
MLSIFFLIEIKNVSIITKNKLIYFNVQKNYFTLK